MESLEDSDSQRRMERVLILYFANLWDRLSTQREEVERVWDTILKKLVQLKNQEIRAEQSATRILEYIQKSLLRLLKDKVPQAQILAEKTFLCLMNDETNRRQLAQSQGCPEGFESNHWLVQIREELDHFIQET